MALNPYSNFLEPTVLQLVQNLQVHQQECLACLGYYCIRAVLRILLMKAPLEESLEEGLVKSMGLEQNTQKHESSSIRIPKSRNIQLIPTLGPEVRNPDLLWTIRNLREWSSPECSRAATRIRKRDWGTACSSWKE